MPRPPAFGAKLVRFDGAAALRIPGVEQVVQTPNGVAVVARHFWAAKLGRDALVVEWQKPDGGGVSTDALLADYRRWRQCTAVSMRVDRRLRIVRERYGVGRRGDR
jgi:isoquinoline 1-oxidoreductase beta subunit